MYLIATHCHASANAPGGVYRSSMLHEVTTKAERAELEERYDYVSRVTAETAHRWVREGGIHSTLLYIGEDRHGRVRVLKAGE